MATPANFRRNHGPVILSLFDQLKKKQNICIRTFCAAKLLLSSLETLIRQELGNYCLSTAILPPPSEKHTTLLLEPPLALVVSNGVQRGLKTQLPKTFETNDCLGSATHQFLHCAHTTCILRPVFPNSKSCLHSCYNHSHRLRACDACLGSPTQRVPLYLVVFWDWAHQDLPQNGGPILWGGEGGNSLGLDAN